MKCVKSSNGDIVRVTDNKAKKLVSKGYKYVNKKEWKAQRGKQSFPNQPQTSTGQLAKVGP